MTTDGPRDPFVEHVDLGLSPVEVKEIEARTALDKALTTLANLAVLTLLLWGVGGFVVLLVRGG